MVTWIGDPTFAGYNPTTYRLDPSVYHFATPGPNAVDLNAITRWHYTPEDSVGGAVMWDRLHPDRPWTTADLSIASSDWTYAGGGNGRTIGFAGFIAPASDFAAGVVPTVDQIAASPNSLLTTSQGRIWVSGPTPPATATWTLRGGVDFRAVQPGTKFWIAILPAYANSATDWTNAGRSQIGFFPGAVGRAISYWTDRVPPKPVITSPANGSYAVAGASIDFKFTSTDPDATLPDDSHRYNADLGSAQIQYAAVPTPENPNPTWSPLPYYKADLSETSARVVRGVFNDPDVISLIESRGLPILCGSVSPLANHGQLPSGEWQVRVRTGSFGHPYPAEVPAVDADNVLSLWSDPVRIMVQARVPAPVPISPTDNNAVAENSTVRFTWDYRNTADSLNTQAGRTIQIREVGSADWATVFNGAGTVPYVDMPPVLDNPDPAPTYDYLSDGNFEAGGTDNWRVLANEDTPSIINASDLDLLPDATNVTGTAPGTTHGGTHALSQASYTLSSTDSNSPYLTRLFTLDPQHDSFSVHGWVKPSDDANILIAAAQWMPATGVNPIPDPDGRNLVMTASRLDPDVWVGDGNGWFEINFEDMRRPLGAVYLWVYTAELAFEGMPVTPTRTIRVDDFSVIGSDTTPLSDFTLEATTNYEWRVRSEDASGARSDYSAPAQFWVVDAPDSGEVLPVPSDTTDGHTLGCGTYDVFIYRRGGTERVGQIRGISHLEWGRLRDDISDAKVVVSDWDIDCGNLLASLQTWAYEVVIFRNIGDATDRVWEGPITLLTYEDDKVTIQAKDVCAYFYRRIMRQKMSDAGTGRPITARAQQILQNAFAPDDPNVLAYLRTLAREDDPMQYRSTPAYSRTAYEEIDDMAANAGLDYTAVGRSILLWATKHRIGTLPEFRDEFLGSAPIVSEYGMSMANRYVVSDGNGVWGEANRLDVSGNDETYGLVEMLSSTWASDSASDSGTYTQAGIATIIESFEEFAERSIADRYGPPVVVRLPDNTSLSPNTPISIQHLVPGVAVPLRSTSTLRTVAATQKLDSMRVTVEADKETITISLSPFSRDDVIAGGEGEE